MMGGTFFSKLAERWAEGKFLCVGLDPDIDKMPSAFRAEHSSVEDAIVAFNKEIIDATADIACAMKPNPALGPMPNA